MQSSCVHRICKDRWPPSAFGAGYRPACVRLSSRGASFDQPHHLIGIDQRGGANPDEGERAGDIPVGHLGSCLVSPWSLLGWASAAPRDERDQACENEEQRAGQREYQVTWQHWWLDPPRQQRRSGDRRANVTGGPSIQGPLDGRNSDRWVIAMLLLRCSAPAGSPAGRGMGSHSGLFFAILNCAIMRLAFFD